MHVTVPTALAFPARWIGHARFANPSKALNYITSLGILEEVVLDAAQDVIRRRTGQLLQPFCKRPGLYEYHTVVYTTMCDTRSSQEGVDRRAAATMERFKGLSRIS